jgi:membrane protein
MLASRGFVRGSFMAVRRIWNETIHDDCIDLAAEMAYFFVLALFPFFVVLGALAGFLPYSNLWTNVSEAIVRHFPSEARGLAFQTLFNLAHRNRTFLSLGFGATVWTSSSGVVCLMENLSRVYNVPETRSFWKKRLIAFGIVVVSSAFFLASFGLLTLGHRLGAFLVFELSLGSSFKVLWALFRWSCLVALLQTGVALIDNTLPNRRRPWRWITPGTIFATAMLLAGTWGVNFYVRHVGHYSQTYGAIGAFFVLMVWIFVSGLTLLVGAEMNAVIEQR